ncbi:SusD/RagB family nutrient-binding outer membrane lipoprotein [Lutibacter sp. A64]|uniref:SusD/RagB family nutrient-binding outer membrane lipoprotein n=1 Tax=Lutibacter sp. A64 TaxID=2918526 RepID=UPI001F051AA6|nr:SusD/RagB family nutrient-binding outer membrane lipoprotein [Lutibacter sp. A64]UMB55247.1 SusD/RagB family nutrient-binding outer membrane lipoprotein [Lutibacter sp. A64]
MKKYIKYANLLIVILLLTSCDDFLDVNVDPNNPTVVTPELVLPVAQKYTANLIQGTDAGGRRANTIGNMLMYNWSQSDGFAWYPDEFKYNVSSSFYSGIFSNSYTQALKQYQILAELDETYDNYKAIAMIMKAYHFQLLVDFYGDIPYTEALLRKDNATPIYDDAAFVYSDLLVQLSAAIELINNTGSSVTPGTDDIIFGGEMSDWVRFANTLRLRIAVRESNASAISEAFAQSEGFITSDVLVNPGYSLDAGKQNPFWNLYGADESETVTLTSKATCATDYVISYLQNTNDPRIDYIYEKPETGHLGVVQGLLDYDTPIVDAYVPENVSNIGPGLLKNASMGACIFTLAESYFNQAEALLSQGGDAKSLYESGIEASFDYLGASGASSYYSQPSSNVSWDSSSNKLEAIITQKWIATNGITAEQSWFDYTRTGYPSNLPISSQASTSDRPVRLYYPASELSSNGGNVPSQPDAFTAKIFWAN